jgi:hypothetical protein
VDVTGALRTFLLADAGVSALVGSQVYAGSLPREIQGLSDPPKAVVLRRAGGGVLGSVNNFGDKRIDIDAYGTNEKEASDIYDAAHLALKGMGTTVVGQVLIHWAIPTADGTSGHDPQTTWPVCVGTFQVLAAEVAAL